MAKMDSRQGFDGESQRQRKKTLSKYCNALRRKPKNIGLDMRVKRINQSSRFKRLRCRKSPQMKSRMFSKSKTLSISSGHSRKV